ncbi:hypothetical protein ACFYXH_40425 [Streptomyces sp. NPDC002730]|uniref:hypothetical protein n=1 Tax=Streptomyces sp. NPDC002730 TaxID=3364662 RepID=UPI0036CF04BF
MADTKDVTVPRQWEPVIVPPQGIKLGMFGKGGSTKTTSLAHMLGHWAADGIPSGAIDADEPGEDEDGSLYTWSRAASFGAPVRKAPANHEDLDVELGLYLPAGGILGLDTPAWERKPETIHMRALSMVDVAVLCLQPTGMELNRAGSMLSAIQQIEAVGGRTPKLVILLARTKAQANAATQTRDTLTEAGYQVLQNEMPDQHAMDGYGQSFAKPIPIDFTSAMGKLSRELATVGAKAVSSR